MSDRLAKRWGRWFVFAWVAMTLSAALLPCREVLAAVAVAKVALHAACGQAPSQAPDSGGDRKAKDCLNLGVPARVPVARLLAPSSSSLVQPAVAISATFDVVSYRPEVSPPPTYRAAPPTGAVYLRSSRLLI